MAIILIVAAVLVVGGGIYYFVGKSTPASNPTPATPSWQTFTHTVTNSNVQISFQYPRDWTVGIFKNYPDQFTIQPTNMFQAESFKKAIVLAIGNNCMNTQCLTRFSLDQLVTGSSGMSDQTGTILKTVTLSDGTKGDYVKNSDGTYAYMFLYKNNTLITFSTDAYDTLMTEIVPTLQIQ